ncbi:hypothetical protein [Sphaerisporangium sp. TRM90804]|uniref:hypothetical protein n=1 Tax=Sphaerisporangium sp. TRM90804 TaxID=3031113 RepID=UPI0024485FB5|nr:hypothetical protein [Sphaerisporangium sp. TRM90804]MDH2425743.1 hypothetical protein [Sphaerisporangium sp. TRM90804]
MKLRQACLLRGHWPRIHRGRRATICLRCWPCRHCGGTTTACVGECSGRLRDPPREE